MGPTLPFISQVVSRLPCTQMPDCEDVGCVNTVCPVADASHLLGSQPGSAQETQPPSQSWLVQGWAPEASLRSVVAYEAEPWTTFTKHGAQVPRVIATALEKAVDQEVISED